jgi:predicted HTH domain antitoxin
MFRRDLKATKEGYFMATKKVTFELELPEELVASFESLEVAGQEAKEAFVMELLRQGKLSQGKAAELLNVDHWQLMDLMAAHDVPATDMSEDELDAELSRWQQRHPHKP